MVVCIANEPFLRAKCQSYALIVMYLFVAIAYFLNLSSILTPKLLTLFRHFAINACLAPLYSLEGMHIITVEGIGDRRRGLHPVQVMHCFCMTCRYPCGSYLCCQYDPY